MYVYHVVTERPMVVGQKIIFDEIHHSGVYERVYEKRDVVNDIYAHPDQYSAEKLEHHTAVALRELALEEIRQEFYPTYPSRMSCLYVSKTLEEAIKWADFFIKLGRPTFHIVKLKVEGNYFEGDATKCFTAGTNKQENLQLARLYWETIFDEKNETSVREILVGGMIEVIEIVKELNKNVVK